MNPEVFNRIIDAIISREIPNAGNRTLLGYSIGGRIALALLVDRPAAWHDVILLAPDGLKQSPFYAITVHTRFGRWAWFWMDRHEQWVWKRSDALFKRGLISKHLHGFIYFHSSSHAMRMMVWKGWRATEHAGQGIAPSRLRLNRCHVPPLFLGNLTKSSRSVTRSGSGA